MGLGLCLVCQSLLHAIIQECVSSSDRGERGGNCYDKTALLAGPTFAGVVYHSPLSHMVFVFSLPHYVLGFVSLLKI